MATKTRAERDPRAKPGPTPLSGRRILCVGDDPFIRRALSRILTHAGAICLLAATHDQAITIVEREPALALVILDFEMSDGDIGQLVARLRTARPALELIGISGADRRVEFAAYGVAIFLEKPWKVDSLVRAMGW